MNNFKRIASSILSIWGIIIFTTIGASYESQLIKIICIIFCGLELFSLHENENKFRRKDE